MPTSHAGLSLFHVDPSPIDLLREVNATRSKCHKCQFHEIGSPYLYGGPLNPELLIVVLAPRVDRAMHFLSKTVPSMLKGLQVAPANYGILPVFACPTLAVGATPSKKYFKTLEKESKKCLESFKETARVVDPAIVLILGEDTAHTLYGKVTYFKLLGRTFDFPIGSSARTMAFFPYLSAWKKIPEGAQRQALVGVSKLKDALWLLKSTKSNTSTPTTLLNLR